MKKDVRENYNPSPHGENNGNTSLESERVFEDPERVVVHENGNGKIQVNNKISPINLSGQE